MECPAVDPATGLTLGLDAASALLAVAVAWFFLRSERLLPERGFGVLALAFAFLAVAYALTTLSLQDDMGRRDAYDGARAGAVLLASGLLLFHYVAKRARWRMEIVRVGAVGLATAVATGVGLYVVVPRAAPADASALLSTLRLVASLLLIATSFLVIMEVRARSLWDFRVPLAFVCLAISSYTVAVTALAGAPAAEGWLVYAWRFVGLGMLLSVIWPSRRFAAAPA